MAEIGRYDLFSDGQFHLAEKFSSDSPYWKIENGKIFYILWDVIRGKYIEHSRVEKKCTEEEALKDNCHSYYKILS